MPELKPNRTPLPHRDPQQRRQDFEEVALGFSNEAAKDEASRCLACPKPKCVPGCPAGINIPGFIKAIQEGDMPRAVGVLKEKNSLPGVCGRVCPQETQCEVRCVVGKKGEPLAIGGLERYVADWQRRERFPDAPLQARPTGKKVAVVGSGPAGLTCAADLARAGHQVSVFEALHIPGGVLVYGIPEFRLPKEIVRMEVDYIRSLGVDVRLDMVVGKTFTLDELLTSGYHAIFLGTGAGLPMFMNVPGEDLTGVYSANEFLVRINLMKAYLFPEYDTPVKRGQRVAVVGGGNVAMDSARCALRLGAKEVILLYRRTEAEMPARKEEMENAREEGIVFRTLAAPVAFLGDDGRLAAVECQEMELGEPDASGRPRPIPTQRRFTLEIDLGIIALGTSPNPLLPTTTPGLQTSPKGTVVANETGLTTRPRVWAAGDVVSGAATVISAIGQAKKAALAIDTFLQNGA